jgi:zinc protease
MQFKGTPSFASGVLDRAISREGGYWNAMTFMDWTTYFETMPADKIDIALQLEAERMTQSLFEEAEVESERTVITSERQGNENSPLFLLGEAVQAASFRVHPYHHEVIGDMADLLTMNREDLYGHYRAYYVPNNAVVAMAGDFEAGPMLERIRGLFESVPAGTEPLRLQREEPEPHGEIRLEVEGPGETTFIQAAYRAPAGREDDFFAFTVLDSLLSGPSSLNMFGGGISNNTSRLYQSLVEREYAVSVYGGLQATIHPFLYGITLTLHPERRPEEAIAALDGEIQRLLVEPPKQEELERAVKQARALFAYGSESITNQAFWLGYSEMFDSYDWFQTYLDRLAAVTPEDVHRVANAYLIPRRRVLGVYKPTGGDEGGPEAMP